MSYSVSVFVREITFIKDTIYLFTGNIEERASRLRTLATANNQKLPTAAVQTVNMNSLTEKGEKTPVDQNGNCPGNALHVMYLGRSPTPTLRWYIRVWLVWFICVGSLTWRGNTTPLTISRLFIKF